MVEIIRVFPRRTKYTPRDPLAFVGEPPLIRPDADEVHVSCTFTWDIPAAERLRLAWEQYYPVVKIGGPAYATPADSFTRGRYIMGGVTFTSRGCNNNCPWCHVREREGRLLEIPITAGNIVQDNNLLQCNRLHIDDVLAMLKTQKKIILSGGLQADLITPAFVEQIRGLSLRQLFTACDYKEALPAIIKAGKIMQALPRYLKRCYVMIGYGGESLSEAEERLRAVWAAGFVPFAQLYQPKKRKVYSRDWQLLAKQWSRPAIIASIMKGEKNGRKRKTVPRR